MAKRNLMRNLTEFTFGVANYDRYWQARKSSGDFNQTGIHRGVAALVRQYVPRGAKVLDCGVGPGIYFRELAAEYEMHGIEISQEAIELYPFDHSLIVPFDLNHGLPQLGTKFGGMIACMILHHLDDPRNFLRAAREALEPGGVLLIIHPNLVHYKHRLRLLAGRFPKYSTSHRNFIAPRALMAMIGQAGFSIRSVTSRKRKWFPLLFAYELFFVCET